MCLKGAFDDMKGVLSAVALGQLLMRQYVTTVFIVMGTLADTETKKSKFTWM